MKVFQRNHRAGIFSCMGIVLAAGLAVAIAAPRASSSAAQTTTPPPSGPAVPGAPQGSSTPGAEAAAAAPAASIAQTAGDAFMNVTVLKDAPADQLLPAMEFITTSLGVRCSFCHVVPNFEDDSKQPKTVARKMMQMEMDINKANFNGHVEVTCNTCHRGAAHPVSTPQIPEDGQMAMAHSMPPMAQGGSGGMGPGGPAGSGAGMRQGGPGAGMGPGGPGGSGAGMGPDAQGNQPPLPTADQIIDKYTQAIGGADAFAKLNSTKVSGTGTLVGEGPAPQSVTIQIVKEAPNKRWISIAGPNGTVTQGTDGTDFWQQDSNGHVHGLQGTGLMEMKRAADMTWLMDIRKNFSQTRVVGMDQVGDHKVYVVIGVPTGGGARERLLFDAESGLLLRYAFVAPSPIGNNPIEGDFSDYRDAGGGLKVPFTIRAATASSTLTIHFSQVQLNVPVDESKFAKPVDTAPPMPAPTEGSASPAQPPAKP